MTIKQLTEYLVQFPDDLDVAVFYDLNDWPGDSWEILEANAKVIKPIELTKTGSAHPKSGITMLIFDIRPKW